MPLRGACAGAQQLRLPVNMSEAVPPQAADRRRWSGHGPWPCNLEFGSCGRDRDLCASAGQVTGQPVSRTPSRRRKGGVSRKEATHSPVSARAHARPILSRSLALLEHGERWVYSHVCMPQIQYRARPCGAVARRTRESMISEAASVHRRVYIAYNPTPGPGARGAL
jgi:hypothetical protein